MNRTLMAAVIIAALSLSGCGSERPDREKLAAALTANDMTKKQARCAAEVLLSSDLSDEALKAIAEKDADYRPNKTDIKAQAAAVDQLMSCRS